jgi:hypothetical protein
VVEDKLSTTILAAAFRLGYLVNFGEPHLKTGIKRPVNG